MNFKNILGASCACLAVVSFNANASLLGRLPSTPGGTDYQAYYDDVADLTWLADADYAKTSGYVPFGVMNWAEANAWAAGLTVGGVGGWRLANSDACSGNCTNSEMGNLFYNVLGNTAGALTDIGPFSNVQGLYWLATEDPGVGAWFFNMNNGFQSSYIETYDFSAWPVQLGDVVPVPAAVWLFGSGLLGLIGVARRKSANP